MKGSFNINSDFNEIRSNETGVKVWKKICKGDENIYEKGTQKCWHPLLLHPWYKDGILFFCMECYAINPMYRKEDRYYQDILARFE